MKARQQFKLADRPIGGGAPVFITFEAGPTHSGVETAKKLIDHAAAAGADAIKFQIVDPDRLVADRAQLFSYNVLVDRATGAMEAVQEPLYDILKRRALSATEWREVKAHSDARGLAFFATVAFEDEIELLEGIGCHSIKIASADINHLALIRRAARTGMCIQIDTGSSNLGEIETAVDAILAEGNDKIVIHQCPSGYPAHLESINLRLLTTLQQLFPFPVAFSDHTPGATMDIAAVALGADLVEKTITLDRTTRSIEHLMSLEPEDMAAFIETIRSVETALGTTRRILHDEERTRRNAVRRSTFLSAPVKAGQKLSEASVIFRRPGFGLGPDVYETMTEARFRRDLPAGQMLTQQDFD